MVCNYMARNILQVLILLKGVLRRVRAFFPFTGARKILTDNFYFSIMHTLLDTIKYKNGAIA